MRVLLTGGNGFIATHILDLLLQKGHSVVTTVRSQDKADYISSQYPGVPKSRLEYAFVPDIAQEGAFDKAIVSEPPFEAVVHTASPVFFTDDPSTVDKNLAPAIVGTTGILKSIKALAPTVRRVIITSSFAAIQNRERPVSSSVVYSEADWNPTTRDDAIADPHRAYSASKKLAERAAWDFVADEKPAFSLAVINPPMVYGPPMQHVPSLEALNFSTQSVRDMLLGEMRDQISETRVWLWCDVRDIAEAHMRALELDGAGGKRFLVAAGNVSHRAIADILRSNFPQYAGVLPRPDAPGGAYPDAGPYQADNTRAKELLGRPFISLEKSIVDQAKTLEPMVEAKMKA